LERNKNFYRLSILIVITILVLAAAILLATNHIGVRYFRLFFNIISIILFLNVAIMLLGFLEVRNILKQNEKSDDEMLQHTANETRNNNPKVSVLSRIALRYFMPVILSISDLTNYYKDEIRRIYIKANNQYVLSVVKKCAKDKILIVLPHCLQNSKCSNRIRNALDECVQCQACNLGDIKEKISKHGVAVEIATGGTSARKVIRDVKPEFVIAVACERDLTSGLTDVKGIPVYGILNKRPNGPCKDTFVDVDELERVIEHFAL